MRANRPTETITRQQGSALIVSLIMLLLISLIAVAGMNTTILQERMSANLYDRDLAFQAAEAALREGENLAVSRPVITNSNGLYDLNSNNRPQWGGGNSTANNAARAYSDMPSGVAVRPQFYVEHITTFIPPGTETDAGSYVEPPYYKVTARGFGGSQETVVVVSSVVRAP